MTLPSIKSAIRLSALAWRTFTLLLASVFLLNAAATRGQQKIRLDDAPHIVKIAAATSDLQLVATGCSDGTISLWDLATGKVRSNFKGGFSGIDALSFSPDGKSLVSGSLNGSLVCWDVAKGTRNDLLKTPWWKANPIYSVSFSHDGRMLALGRLYDLCLWDVRNGRVLDSFVKPAKVGNVGAVAFSADSKTLAVAGKRFEGKLARSLLTLWDVATWKEKAECDIGDTHVNSIALTGDSKTLISGSDDHVVRIWRAEIGDPMLTLRQHHSAVTSVAVSPDGQTVASAGLDDLVLWEAKTGRLLVAIDEPGGFRSIRFSADGKTLMVAFQEIDGPPLKWEVADLIANRDPLDRNK